MRLNRSQVHAIRRARASSSLLSPRFPPINGVAHIVTFLVVSVPGEKVDSGSMEAPTNRMPRGGLTTPSEPETPKFRSTAHSGRFHEDSSAAE